MSDDEVIASDVPPRYLFYTIEGKNNAMRWKSNLGVHLVGFLESQERSIEFVVRTRREFAFLEEVGSVSKSISSCFFSFFAVFFYIRQS